MTGRAAWRLAPVISLLLGWLVWLGMASPGLAASDSAAQATEPGPPARLALVIGNAAYAVAPLSNPVHDARLMDETLRALGFRTTLRLDANRDAMQGALADFSRRLRDAGPDAVGLVFFAGHGVQINGDNFLVPVDARLRDAMDVRTRAVDASLVMRSLEEAGNRLNVVILDACRDNPFPSLGRSVSRGLARLEAPRGTLIAYSTAPGSVALDGEGRNSPYTKALAVAMRRPGLLIEQVFKQARIDVMRATKEQQIPWENSSLVGDFRFLDEGAVAPAPAPSLNAVSRPPADASAGGRHPSVEGRWVAASASGLVLLMRAGRYSSFQGSILIDAGLYEVSGEWIRSTSQYNGQVMAYRYTLSAQGDASRAATLTLQDSTGHVMGFTRAPER